MVGDVFPYIHFKKFWGSLSCAVAYADPDGYWIRAGNFGGE
jgi:hypothetical protein